MNRILFICGQQNRTVLSKFNSISPATIFKPSLWYKPIETGCRFLKTSAPVRSAINKRSLDIDPTALTKDVIIYKYENPKYFKFMNIFALVQFALLSYCSQATLVGLRNRPVDKEADGYEQLPWYQKYNLGNDRFRQGMSLVLFGIGFAVLAMVWTFTLRSVRYLILRKGGGEISFVTYGPLGTNRINTVPLRCVTGLEKRETARTFLPLKVKNIRWYFVLDVRGKYMNQELFDHVVNTRRRF